MQLLNVLPRTKLLAFYLFSANQSHQRVISGLVRAVFRNFGSCSKEHAMFLLNRLYLSPSFIVSINSSYYCFTFGCTNKSYYCRPVILKGGFTKQGQGFLKATFVKNCAVNSERNCQSCKYTPRLHVERRSISKNKKIFIRLTLSNIISQSKVRGSVYFYP